METPEHKMETPVNDNVSPWRAGQKYYQSYASRSEYLKKYYREYSRKKKIETDGMRAELAALKAELKSKSEASEKTT